MPTLVHLSSQRPVAALNSCATGFGHWCTIGVAPGRHCTYSDGSVGCATWAVDPAAQLGSEQSAGHTRPLHRCVRGSYTWPEEQVPSTATASLALHVKYWRQSRGLGNTPAAVHSLPLEHVSPVGGVLAQMPLRLQYGRPGTVVSQLCCWSGRSMPMQICAVIGCLNLT